MKLKPADKAKYMIGAVILSFVFWFFAVIVMQLDLIWR